MLFTKRVLTDCGLYAEILGNKEVNVLVKSISGLVSAIDICYHLVHYCRLASHI